MSIQSLRRGAIAASRVLATTVTVADFPGSTGNYATTPDSAGNSVTGDIDLRVKLSMDDWTPATDQRVLSKWIATGDQRSYRFGVNADGTLHLGLSSAGTAGTTASVASSAATGYTDGTVHWIRVTWRNSDDRTQFFTSEDGSNWTQLGTNRTVSATGIFDGTGELAVSGQEGGTANLLAAQVHRAEVRNGIDGTVGANFDPSGVTILGTRNPTSFVAPTTGETWTMNGAAWDWVTV